MKTAGELLHEARVKKEKTIEEIAEKIKVKPEYLKALEENRFSSLPSATFTKGFLRKYAFQLRINPDTVVAMFRRDFAENEKGEIVPKGLVEPVNKKNRHISMNIILSAVAIASFLTFFGFQLYKYYSLPKLEVLQPVNSEVYTPKITVKGKTDPDNVVTINNQKVVLNPSGEFSLDLTFPAGTHSVIVQSTNRQNKSKIVQRTFQITK